MMKRTLAAMQRHAVTAYPNEAVGIVIASAGTEKYLPCTNIADKPQQGFKLPAEEYAAAEDEGEILYIFHSHPDDSSSPSTHDKIMCEASGHPWIIIGLHKDLMQAPNEQPVVHEPVTLVPCGYRAPLVGRPFIHGVLDCYALIKDYLDWEMDVKLPEYVRTDGWWNDGKLDLYREHMNEHSVPISLADLRKGDIILMQYKAPVTNHSGVYLGDGTMLHHLYSMLSIRVPYGGTWIDRTTDYRRPKGLL